MKTIYTIIIPLLNLISVNGSDLNQTITVPPILDPSAAPSAAPTIIPPILDPTGIPSGIPTSISGTESEPMWGLFGLLGVVVPIFIVTCITNPNLFCDLARLITCKKRKNKDEIESSESSV